VHLENLHLDNNNFEGEVPKSLKSLEHLVVLKLENNKLSGKFSFVLFCFVIVASLTFFSGLAASEYDLIGRDGACCVVAVFRLAFWLAVFCLLLFLLLHSFLHSHIVNYLLLVRFHSCGAGQSAPSAAFGSFQQSAHRRHPRSPHTTHTAAGAHSP